MLEMLLEYTIDGEGACKIERGYRREREDKQTEVAVEIDEEEKRRKELEGLLEYNIEEEGGEMLIEYNIEEERGEEEERRDKGEVGEVSFDRDMEKERKAEENEALEKQARREERKERY